MLIALGHTAVIIVDMVLVALRTFYFQNGRLVTLEIFFFFRIGDIVLLKLGT